VAGFFGVGVKSIGRQGLGWREKWAGDGEDWVGVGFSLGREAASRCAGWVPRWRFGLVGVWDGGGEMVGVRW